MAKRQRVGLGSGCGRGRWVGPLEMRGCGQIPGAETKASSMDRVTPAGRGVSVSPQGGKMRGRGANGGQACTQPWVLLERDLEPELGRNPGGSPGFLSAELHPGPGAGHGLLLWAGGWAPLTTKQDRGPESPQPRRREAGSWHILYMAWPWVPENSGFKPACITITWKPYWFNLCSHSF